MAVYISLPNQKGGVGKTSMCLHLAWRFQELGLRVLAVDFDPQGNFSESLLGAEVLDEIEVQDDLLYTSSNGNSSGVASRSYHLLNEELVWPLSPVETKYKGLYVLPASIDDSSLQAVNKRPVSDAVYASQHLRQLDDKFDVVVMDVPPQKDTLHLAGVIAADKIVLPIMMSAYPMRGVRAMQITLRELADEGVFVELVGVLVNIYNTRSTVHEKGVELLENRLGALVLKNKIGYRTSLDTAVGDMRPVWTVSSGAARGAAKQVRGAMDEIISKCGFESELLASLKAEKADKKRRQQKTAKKAKLN